MVVVRRPETGDENSFAEVEDLLRALRERWADLYFACTGL